MVIMRLYLLICVQLILNLRMSMELLSFYDCRGIMLYHQETEVEAQLLLDYI